MKNKRWILLWLLCLGAAFGLYIQTAVTEAARPPAPGWSRGLPLGTLKGLSAYELRSNEGIGVALSPEGTRILYPDKEKGLVQLVVDSSGEISDKKVLEAGTETVEKVRMSKEDKGLILTVLQGQKLNHYHLDNGGVKPLGSESITDIRDFDLLNGQLAALTPSGFFVRTDKKDAWRSVEGPFRFIRWMPAETSTLSTVTEKDGRKLLQFWDVSHEPRVLAEWSLPADVQTAVESVVPYGDDATTGALVELKDFKTGMVRLVDYRLRPAKQEKEVLSSSGDINPVVMGMEKGLLQVLLTQEQQKGDDQVVWNIRQAQWDGAVLKKGTFVTQTDAASIPVYAWGSGAGRYVLNVDISGDTKKIMLSGNTPELIERTAGLSREELTDLLPSVVMTLLPSLMVGLFPAVYIIVPVLLTLFLITFFRLSWAEANYLKLIRFSVIGHILLKVFFAFRWVLYNGNIPNISAQLPWYLNSTGAMLITLAIATGAAWFAAELRNKEKTPGDFWGPYGSFAMIDLSIFILLVMPYYYAYVGLPVFLR